MAILRKITKIMFRLNSGDFSARKSNIENFSEIILFIDRLKTNFSWIIL